MGVVLVLFIDSSSGWFSIKSKWLPGERVLAAATPLVVRRGIIHMFCMPHLLLACCPVVPGVTLDNGKDYYAGEGIRLEIWVTLCPCVFRARVF